MTNAEVCEALDWVLGRESRAMDRNSARKLLDLRELFAARAADEDLKSDARLLEYDKSDAQDEPDPKEHVPDALRTTSIDEPIDIGEYL